MMENNFQFLAKFFMHIWYKQEENTDYIPSNNLVFCGYEVIMMKPIV